MSRYCKDENGNLLLIAGGTRFWLCTQARHDAEVAAGTAPNNCLVAITDDWVSDTENRDISSTVTADSSVSSFKVIRCGNVVSIDLTINSATNNTIALRGLPKPASEFNTYGSSVLGSGSTTTYVRVETNGNVIYSGSSAGTATGHIIYIAEEE